MPDDRPNILFILADDQSFPHAGYAGDPVVRTPAYDRLAEEGVAFTNAYISAPSCTPSRASVLTGRNHWELEDTGNLFSTWPGWRVYPDALADAGYRTGYCWKGWAPCDPAFRGDSNPAGPHFRDFEQFMSEDGDEPFCFWVGSTRPHRPYVEGSGVQAGMKLDDIEVPPFLPDCEPVRADIADYLLQCEVYDSQVMDCLTILEETGRYENTLIVVTSDNGMPFPRAKANLYDYGTRMPMVVAWPDVIDGGRTVTDFVSCADVAPTFMEAAGLEPLAEMSGRSFLDVVTCARSGRVDASRDRAHCGRERHTTGRQGDVGYPMRCLRTDEFLYILNYEPDRWPAGERPTHLQDVDQSITKDYMIANADLPEVAPLYELAFGMRPAEELYDLRIDPDQMVNVAGVPEYNAIRRRLQGELLDYLAATGDPRLDEDGFDFDRAECYWNGRWFPRQYPEVFTRRPTP
ncbi:MAG: sulfatase-like hydrolase/transferase [Armatimonadia bacterium]|nr:sulfatase-like hydrolase/transferase [Armatimonadia bacterium]